MFLNCKRDFPKLGKRKKNPVLACNPSIVPHTTPHDLQKKALGSQIPMGQDDIRSTLDFILSTCCLVTGVFPYSTRMLLRSLQTISLSRTDCRSYPESRPVTGAPLLSSLRLFLLVSFNISPRVFRSFVVNASTVDIVDRLTSERTYDREFLNVPFV